MPTLAAFRPILAIQISNNQPVTVFSEFDVNSPEISSPLRNLFERNTTGLHDIQTECILDYLLEQNHPSINMDTTTNAAVQERLLLPAFNTHELDKVVNRQFLIALHFFSLQNPTSDLSRIYFFNIVEFFIALSSC